MRQGINDLGQLSVYKPYKPIVLVIIDGWGLSPSWGGNAISMNNPPHINKLWREYPHKILRALSAVIEDQNTVIRIANSEVGHASIGTGRMIRPDVADINIAIEGGAFFKNKIIKDAIDHAKKHHSKLHLLGLLSEGGVHSHLSHLYALLEFAKRENFNDVFIHIITDGRDSEPTEAIIFIEHLLKKINDLGVGQIATICGRFYAMDRDSHFDRTRQAFRAQTDGQGVAYATDPLHAISQIYKQGYTDEFIPPIVFVENLQSKKPVGKIGAQDAVIFFNFRADRARQLSNAYLDTRVGKKKISDLYFATLTDYNLKLPVKIIFPPSKIKNSLSNILSFRQLKQLHLAESEKYAHVTYFFNGGYEEPFPGEDRLIIPSPKVVDFSQTPEMSTKKITQEALKAIISKKYDFILINFASVDMVGHTGDIMAVAKSIKVTDDCIRQISEIILTSGGALIITADHGNAEQMVHHKNCDPETLHTLNPVPFILVTADNHRDLIKSSTVEPFNMLSEILTTKNTLADIAPTILEMLHIQKPSDMEGRSLLTVLE